MADRPSLMTVINLVGATALIGGAYLPWARRTNATIALQTLDRLSNFHRGIEIEALSYDVVVLAAGVIAVTAVGFTTRQRINGGVTALAGLLGVGIALEFLVTSVVDFTGGWVPDLGWYLTIAAGGLLLVHGVHRTGTVPAEAPIGGPRTE